MKISELKSELRGFLVTKSLCHGDFTLTSGAKSDCYVDAKLTTLDPRGAWLVGKIGWEIVKELSAVRAVNIQAIGGLTIGADPIAQAISLASYLDEPDKAIQSFVVRKSPKKHGRHKLIEGSFNEDDVVVVVDDVVTTGGSTLKAIEAVEAAGGRVGFVLWLVDREEGAREIIEKRGLHVNSIFTLKDLTSSTDSAVAQAR